jgi:hypothetical protein
MAVETKYRGKPAYFRVLAELIRAAEYRGLTTYQHLAVIMELPLQGNLMGSEIGQILGEVCEEEIAAGRPMLSAVAVGTSGKPGSGFLPLAVELERAGVDENLDDVWTRERTAVYRAWERPLPRD